MASYRKQVGAIDEGLHDKSARLSIAMASSLWTSEPGSRKSSLASDLKSLEDDLVPRSRAGPFQAGSTAQARDGSLPNSYEGYSNIARRRSRGDSFLAEALQYYSRKSSNDWTLPDLSGAALDTSDLSMERDLYQSHRRSRRSSSARLISHDGSSSSFHDLQDCPQGPRRRRSSSGLLGHRLSGGLLPACVQHGVLGKRRSSTGYSTLQACAEEEMDATGNSAMYMDMTVKNTFVNVDDDDEMTMLKKGSHRRFASAPNVLANATAFAGLMNYFDLNKNKMPDDVNSAEEEEQPGQVIQVQRTSRPASPPPCSFGGDREFRPELFQPAKPQRQLRESGFEHDLEFRPDVLEPILPQWQAHQANVRHIMQRCSELLASGPPQVLNDSVTMHQGIRAHLVPPTPKPEEVQKNLQSFPVDEENNNRKDKNCKGKPKLSGQPWCHICISKTMIDVEGSSVAGRIIGQGGCNTKRIHEATDAKIRLRGKASGHFERKGKQAPVPLTLAITGHTKPTWRDDFVQAVDMSIVLLAETQKTIQVVAKTNGTPLSPGYHFYVSSVSESARPVVEQLFANWGLICPKSKSYPH